MISKFVLFLAFSLCTFAGAITMLNAQSTLPVVNLKTVEGKTVSSKTFSNNGKPMVVNFWATWCKPCVKELKTIHEVYETWQAETGVKIIAISIDDSRSVSKVGPFVNAQGWEYEVYIDENSDFKRALNIPNVPHTILLDGQGKIVWQHNAYIPGDENKLYEQIKLLTGK